MDDEIVNKWNNSTTFLIAMVGAIIGLNGIWKFSYLIYENGGGTFLIPYIVALVVLVIPFMVLESGLGFKFKSSLPRIFYNIKEEFEIIGWFVVFLIFMVLVYCTCIIGWDLVYIVLSLFKGWGSNPSVFFTTTLLHSSSSPYGLTYLVVPIGIALLVIWGFIYFVSKREINKGISNLTKISLIISLILIAGLIIYALQLPGSRTGVRALFNPNWEFLFNANVWLTAFGQLVFSYGIGYGILSSYSSYLPNDVKLVDNTWAIVLISLIAEILFSVLIFAILGFMALGNNISITSLVSDGFSLIFVVLPTAFNLMGPWVYIIAPAFFLILLIVGINAAIALIEPLSYAISDKFDLSREQAVKNLVFIGLFASFIFATGMGEYLLRIVDSFINNFAIILAVLLEVIVVAWAYNIENLIDTLNKSSFIKIGKFWTILIKFVIPIILLIVWIAGVYNLIIVGDRQSLLVQSIVASIFVLVPLALTVIPPNNDYYLDIENNKTSYNYFKDTEENNNDNLKPTSNFKSKDNTKLNSSSKSKSKSSSKSNGDSTSKSKSQRKLNLKSDSKSKSKSNPKSNSNDESKYLFDETGSFIDSFRFKKRRKNNKNVLKDVDLSSKEFDSVYDNDDEDNTLNNGILPDNYDIQDLPNESLNDFDNLNDFKEDKKNSKLNKNDSKSKSKSIFDKVKSIDKLSNLSHNHDNDSQSEINDDNLEEFIDTIVPIDDSLIENGGIKSNSSNQKSSNNKKQSNTSKNKPQFKKSKDIDFEGFSNSSDSNLSQNQKNNKTSSKSNDNYDVKSSKTNDESKANSKTDSKTNHKTKSKRKFAKKSEPKVEDLGYDDFTDDFFDDGVFGDEGYESLLDDYQPKSKSSSKLKNDLKPKSKSNIKPQYKYESKKPKSLKRKVDDEEDYDDFEDNENYQKEYNNEDSLNNEDNKNNNANKKYYDFEGKGADSVFRLDE